MAIGDTVQAGLMRVDSSPIQIAGAAQARANQAFGQALEKTAIGFFQGQAKKKKNQEAIQGLTSLFPDAPPELIKAMAKNPEVMQAKQQHDQLKQQMEIAKMRDATTRSEGGANRAQTADIQEDAKNLREEQKAEKRIATDFKQKLLSETVDPAIQANFDQAQPGLFALGGDPTQRNQFLEAQRDQQPKIVAGELGSSDFARFAQENQLDPDLAYNRFINLQAQEQKAQQKDAPTISRVVNMQDGKGGFEQVGVDSSGNPIRSFGPPKPSGMFATPDQQADARAKTLSVDNANDFVNTQRNSALDSAKSIRPATRALTLLEKGDLDTGGIAEFKTNAIAMLDSLGIPMDQETMDKVANTQNFRAEVGKFLFENISNTKGSISEKEMDIFAKISPGLQMTPEANKTLLNYVIKKAERDKEKVKFIQKMRRDGVSITEQRNKLEDYMLKHDLSGILSPIAGEPSGQQSKELQTFRLGQKQVKGEIVGVRPDGLNLIKTVDGKIFVQPAQ